MIISGVISLINLVFELYTAALIVYALLSWFPEAYNSFIGKFLSTICDPYLKIFDRLNLNFGGISFSIMAAIIVLNFSRMFIMQLIYKLFLV